MWLQSQAMLSPTVSIFWGFNYDFLANIDPHIRYLRKQIRYIIKGDNLFIIREMHRAIYRGDPPLFERLFVICWEDNRDCHITMPLSLKTMEVQIKGDQWNKRFRTVQVYCIYMTNLLRSLTSLDHYYNFSAPLLLIAIYIGTIVNSLCALFATNSVKPCSVARHICMWQLH